MQQLLDFARPEPLAIKPCRINAQIKDLLDMLGPRCINQHIRVRFSPAADPSLLLAADESKICQALLNIFLNAIDAMPAGGELTVSTRAVHADKGPAVMIRVTDTGPRHTPGRPGPDL